MHGDRSANCAENRRDSTCARADVPVKCNDKFEQFPEAVGGVSDQPIDRWGFFAAFAAFFGLLLTELCPGSLWTFESLCCSRSSVTVGGASDQFIDQFH